MQNIIKYLERAVYWAIVTIPLSMAISPALMNGFMGLALSGFLIKRALKREDIFIKTPVNLPLAFLFALTLLSLFNTVSLKDSFRGGVLRFLQYIFMLLAVSGEVKDKRQIKMIVFSVIVGLLFTAGDEIWQVFAGKDFVRGYDVVVNIGLVRATASFKDSNTLGIYLSAIAPLVFGLTLYYLKGKRKIAGVICSFIALAAIALTYSRPTLLATYVALFFLGVVRKDKGMIIFLVGFALISPFLLPKSVRNLAKEVNYNPLRFMCNDDRIAVYRNSLNMIKAHPFIGVGANAFMSSYKYYKEFPEYRNVVTLEEMKAHNNFLHMAGEIGLIGLSVFLWLLYKLFRECADIYKKLSDDYIKIVSLSLIACIIAFLVNGLTESSLYYSRVALIFWYLAGMSLTLRKFSHGGTNAN